MTDQPSFPLRQLTRLLAEMQTSINAAGIRLFDGDLDRFVIYTLIVRESALWPIADGGDPPRPISTYSLAQSLGRSFETVRRHANALIAAGLCERTAQGVTVRNEALAEPQAAALMTLAHDCFVRFVADLAAAGLELPTQRRNIAYDPPTGIRAAVDTMLAVLDGNVPIHGEWLDLVLFSTVACANRRSEPVAPVRASRVAQAIGISQTTAHRRLGSMVARGVLERDAKGLRISPTWLARPEAIATSAASLANVRRLLARLATAGFPFDAPESAYLAGRPPPVAFD